MRGAADGLRVQSINLYVVVDRNVARSSLDVATLSAGFADFTPFLGDCRFANCRHDREPGCGLSAALAAGRVNARRHELFCKFRSEIGA